MSADGAADSEDGIAEPLSTKRRKSRDLAVWAFAAAVIVGGLIYAVIGRHFWFAGGEWAFLVERSVSVRGLLEPHLGHFVALPVIEYRTLFNTFGLRAYWPYEFIAIGLHLTAACLLRVVMRRCEVGPWIATAAATLFVFFGAGAQNILWGLQSSLTGALVLGLVQLLCADHDGGIERRDWLGLLAGLAALCCSGVALSIIGVVGVAVLIRRGWRAALFHIGPLAAVYVVWSRLYNTDTDLSFKPGPLFRWSARGLTGTFNALTQVPFLGWVLAAVLLGGFVLAFRSWGTDWRRKSGIPVAFLFGAIGFEITNGLLRINAGVPAAAESRYLWVVAALVLVPLAVAADAIARHNRWVAVAVVALFLVGIPGNIATIGDAMRGQNSYLGGLDRTEYARTFEAIPGYELAQIPPSLHPDPSGNPWVTVGWLRSLGGKLPSPGYLTSSEQADVRLRLSLVQTVITTLPGNCHYFKGEEQTLDPEQPIDTFGAFTVQLGNSSPQRYGMSLVGLGYLQRLEVSAPLRVRITPVEVAEVPPAFFCLGPPALHFSS